MSGEFRHLVYGEWPAAPTEREQYAIDAWLGYYRRIEAFDRTLPGGLCPHSPGMWRPFPQHMPASQAVATRALRELFEHLRDERGYSYEDIEKAKHQALVRHERELARGT